MKHTMKKVIAVCLLAAVACSAFGCSKKTSDSDMAVETISLEQTKQDLTFDFSTKGSKSDAEDATEAKDDTTGAADDSSADASEAFEEVTQVQNVTDAEGHGVTDAKGEPATEMVVVGTRPAQNQSQKQSQTQAQNQNQNQSQTQAQNQNQNQSQTQAQNQDATQAQNQEQTPATQAGANTDGEVQIATKEQQEAPQAQDTYTPAYDTCKAYWLDMTQQGDYNFNGEFLTITFEINKDIPDGSYPVTIAKTDIASWDLVRYNPVIVNGEVAVNSELMPQDDLSADEFCLKVNSQAAKQGETVTMTIDLANNPGFCGFVIDVQYDSNAMTIVEAAGGKDFDSAVHLAG